MTETWTSAVFSAQRNRVPSYNVKIVQTGQILEIICFKF